LKHHRKVALKVLRPELAAVLGAERFVHEITTTANLQHPHILPLFDSGEADGFLYYVMPFIDGETLRDKLNRETQLGIEEAVRITTEVADALDYAHRHNVIHRDIKPENILLHDGRPTVADFGIALAVSAAAGGRMTETGMSLGTPHYMSPEQATAEKDLTSRSDIYSLGCVLYELLTGEPPHMGNSAQQIIMKIVTDDARPVSELRKSVPPNVAAATAKALEKLPADRFATAEGFGKALGNRSFAVDLTTAKVAPAAASTLWNPLAKGLVVFSGVLLAVLAWVALRPTDGIRLGTYDVGLPRSAPMLIMDWRTSLSISPAGDFVVYRAPGDTSDVLWFRSLVDTTAYRIGGTEGALSPAVSPSGEQVAFITRSEVKIVSVTGGTATVLADLTNSPALRWVSDSRLLVTDNDGNMFRWIDVETETEQSQDVQYCLSAQPLQAESLMLCGGGGDPFARVRNLSADTFRYVHFGGSEGEVGPHLRGGDLRLVDDAYLIYVSLDGDLRAVSFNPETLEAGRPVTLVKGVRRQSYSGLGQYSVSENGTLVYAAGSNGSVGHFVKWNEGEEDPIRLLEDADMFLRFAISPDENRLAVVVAVTDGEELRIYDLRTGSQDVWLREMVIGSPAWADNETLFVATIDLDASSWSFLRGSPNSAGPPDTLFSGTGQVWYTVNSQVGAGEWIVGAWADETGVLKFDFSGTVPRIDTIIDDGWLARLSPDGRRIVYQPGGMGEVEVRTYPELDHRTAIAQQVVEPSWLSNTEILYFESGGKFIRHSVGTSSNTRVGTPLVWHVDSLFSDTPGPSYLITADGGLIYVREPERQPAPYLRVIPNWVEQMKRAVDEANR